MRKRQLIYALSVLVIIGSVLAVAFAISTPINRKTLPEVKEEVSLSKKTGEVPRDDIRRFVTAIAIIHHYYIHPVKNSDLFDGAIRGMVANLDPHSAYLDKSEYKDLQTTVSGEFVGIGIELTLKDGLLKVISPLDGSPAEKAGIKPNDFIIKIDETLVRNMTLEEAVQKIKGKTGSTVQLTVIRKGIDKPLVLNVVRDVIKLVSVKGRLLEDNFGYLRITFFQGPVDQQLQRMIGLLKTQAKGPLAGLILDLRNNPGGLLDVSAKVADEFLDASKLNKYHSYIVYTKGSIPGSDMHIEATAGDIISGVPLVVLINGGSASASEIVAGALQDYHRGIIMGSRSFGKGSVQTVLPVSQDSAIKLTTALYYTPAGRQIQAKGIIPDITVPEFAVKNVSTDILSVDESDFEHHLPNETSDEKNEKSQAALEERQKRLSKQVALAKEDYQIYEALVMLKGMNAMRAASGLLPKVVKNP